MRVHGLILAVFGCLIIGQQFGDADATKLLTKKVIAIKKPIIDAKLAVATDIKAKAVVAAAASLAKAKVLTKKTAGLVAGAVVAPIVSLGGAIDSGVKYKLGALAKIVPAAGLAASTVAGAAASSLAGIGLVGPILNGFLPPPAEATIDISDLPPPLPIPTGPHPLPVTVHETYEYSAPHPPVIFTTRELTQLEPIATHYRIIPNIHTEIKPYSFIQKVFAPVAPDTLFNFVPDHGYSSYRETGWHPAPSVADASYSGSYSNEDFLAPIHLPPLPPLIPAVPDDHITVPHESYGAPKH